MLTDFEKKVLDACKLIPQGSVVTYSDISFAIGSPKASRAVGNALNKNPFSTPAGGNIPCHRVICSSGNIGGYAFGSKKKQEILKEELFE
jgi:O-6-methylguanine DNA methyltransferase